MSAATDAPVLDRRRLLATGLLLAGGGAALALRPRADGHPPPPGTFARVLPRAVGGYAETGASALILPPDSDLRATTYADVLSRIYQAATAPPILLLAAAAAAREPGLTIHRPEECYPAYGFDLSALRPVRPGAPLPYDARATLFTARRDRRVEHVFYWVRVGRAFPGTALQQRQTVAAENLRGRLPGGVLLRLSVIGGEAEAALAAMLAFHAALLAAAGPAGRTVLLGHG